MDRLAEIELKYNCMKKIENGVNELKQLWMEMYANVMKRQERLDNIQENVDCIYGLVVTGTSHLENEYKLDKNDAFEQFEIVQVCYILLY